MKLATGQNCVPLKFSHSLWTLSSKPGPQIWTEQKWQGTAEGYRSRCVHCLQDQKQCFNIQLHWWLQTGENGLNENILISTEKNCELKTDPQKGHPRECPRTFFFGRKIRSLLFVRRSLVLNPTALDQFIGSDLAFGFFGENLLKPIIEMIKIPYTVYNIHDVHPGKTIKPLFSSQFWTGYTKFQQHFRSPTSSTWWTRQILSVLFDYFLNSIYND